MDLTQYDGVSPFEVKDVLLSLARSDGKKALNVGRGNPDWIEIGAHKAFAMLQLLALNLAQNDGGNMFAPESDIGVIPSASLEKRFWSALNKDRTKRKKSTGLEYLKSIAHYLVRELRGDWVGSEKHESNKTWVDPSLIREYNTSDPSDTLITDLIYGALGCYYPTPPIALPLTRRLAQRYIRSIIPNVQRDLDIDIFATEGCCASIAYLFRSLESNGILTKGDTVALYTPIFTPYIEYMQNPEFNYRSLYLRTVGSEDWQLDDSALGKLEHGSAECTAPKVLFMVNPTNPTSVGMSAEVTDKIAGIVERRNASPSPLLIVTDAVYAPMIRDFNSLFARVPRNTILVLSLSKFFGTTGWRLGFTAMTSDNIVDHALLPGLSENAKRVNRRRYSVIRKDAVDDIRFIERLLLDSRGAANAHTAGLSTPQQTLMNLLMARELIEPTKYKERIMDELLRRVKCFLSALWFEKPPTDLNDQESNTIRSLVQSPDRHVHYYVLVDILEIAQRFRGDKGYQTLKNNHPLTTVFELARRYSIVALDGSGFDAKQYTLRVSVANCTASQALDVGNKVRDTVVAVADGRNITKTAKHVNSASGYALPECNYGDGRF